MQSIAVIVGLLLIQLAGACAATLEGRVVGITDGDTVTVLDTANVRHKIRLAAMDAPESRQAFGKVAGAGNRPTNLPIEGYANG